jgi:hypothetical protein
MRRTEAGDEKPIRFATLHPQGVRQFEGKQPTHAVPEQSEAAVEWEYLEELAHQRRKAAAWLLVNSSFAAWQLYGYNFEFRSERKAPSVVRRRASAGEWEAEQPVPRGRIRTKAEEPSVGARRRGCPRVTGR